MTKPVKTETLAIQNFLDKPEVLAEVLRLVPAHSVIHTLPEDVQKYVLKGVLNDIPIHAMVKDLMSQGYKTLTWQQLNRIRKRLMPMVMRDNLPNSFFADTDIRRQFENLEFVINEQYARIVARINDEDELKHTVRLAGNVKIVSEQAYQQFKQDLMRYRAGEMNDLERSAFLMMVEPRGYDPGLTRDLDTLMKLFSQMILLRLKLKDPTLYMGEPPKADPQKDASKLLDPATAQKIAETMRKRALGLADAEAEEAETTDESKQGQ